MQAQLLTKQFEMPSERRRRCSGVILCDPRLSGQVDLIRQPRTARSRRRSPDCLPVCYSISKTNAMAWSGYPGKQGRRLWRSARLRVRTAHGLLSRDGRAAMLCQWARQSSLRETA